MQRMAVNKKRKEIKLEINNRKKAGTPPQLYGD